jgi:8-oxo-dGTP pyrophosphatase MutT (NUDIX family)
MPATTWQARITVITFDDTLRARIDTNLSGHDRRVHPLDGRRHAAVAIVLVDSDAELHDGDPQFPDGVDMSMVPGDTRGLDGRMIGVAGGAAFLLCRRAPRLNSHSGQWALPGGRIDDGEDAVTAALRETDEELGLRLGTDRVLGLLDDYPTRSGYVITPVVVWGGADPEMSPSPHEVQAVYRIGLHALCCDDSPRFIDIPESDRPVVQLPLGNDLIHAPTGAVLVQFRWVGIEGRAADQSRVDEFEQPVFAWR